MVNYKFLMFSIVFILLNLIPLSTAVDTNQNQSYQPTQNEELALSAAFSILIICVILYYSIKDKDEFSAIYSRWHLTEAEKEAKIEKIRKYNKDNKKKRMAIRLACYVISIMIVIFFPWIIVNRVTLEIIMFFGTFFIQGYGFSVFSKYYEKRKIIAWGLLFGSDAISLILMKLLILMSLISNDLIMFPVLYSLFWFRFAIKYSKREPLVDNPFASRRRVSSGGFGGSFGGGFGGGGSGGGGHSGKW